MPETPEDLVHLQHGLNSKPLCGINEPWRKPGEAPRITKTTTVYEEATCLDCKFQSYEGPAVYFPPEYLSEQDAERYRRYVREVVRRRDA